MPNDNYLYDTRRPAMSLASTSSEISSQFGYQRPPSTSSARSCLYLPGPPPAPAPRLYRCATCGLTSPSLATLLHDQRNSFHCTDAYTVFFDTRLRQWKLFAAGMGDPYFRANREERRILRNSGRGALEGRELEAAVCGTRYIIGVGAGEDRAAPHVDVAREGVFVMDDFDAEEEGFGGVLVGVALPDDEIPLGTCRDGSSKYMRWQQDL
ncbi:hypothetical protein EDC01DRAFT_777614 [Geopyxis carbonaria]|nr:hypothetical protein EDC01DRAFT_777614 [Geopyxis carbonaria]